MGVGSDGSIDIKITGSLDPSVAASANEAKASLNGLGASAAGLRPGFDASAASLKQLIAQTGSFAAAQKALAVANGDMAAALAATTVAEEVNTVATRANTGAAINSRAAYESLVLVHEAMQGRFNRMAGSSLILTQQLAGQAATTRFVQAAMSGYGLAIIATVATIGLITAATISYENEQKKLAETTLGLGAASGITVQELKAMGESANSSSQSIRETTKAAEAFAGAGLHDAETVKTLSNSVEAYSQLVGGKFAEAQKALAAAMKDPVKGAKDLHEQLGILDGDQLEQIQTLTALGQKDEAVAIITQALTHRLDEAHQAGVGVRGEFEKLIDVLSNTYEKIGQVTEGFGREAETLLEDLIPALHAAGQAHRDAAAAAQQQATNEAQLNAISARGKEAYDATPAGQSAARLNELKGNLSAARDALKVDTALHGEHSAVVARDREAIEAYSHATRTYLTEVQKKTKADQLDVQIASAKHSHNRQLVADLTEQKALIQESGKLESDADARALAKGSGDVAGARTFAPKGGGKGPSIVSEWQEQLHAAEIASNDFFGDQTERELQFWQSKVGLVKAGSKQWLEVQTHIYDAQKTLAHQEYDEHIADLNDRLEADRNDLTKFRADWEEKLNFIKSKFKEESAEYKNAHRQMVAEERQFQDRLIQEELTGNNKAITALKKNLQDQQQIRNEYSKIAESQLTSKGSTSPFGDITAAAKIGQLHHQLMLQEIQDAQVAFNAEKALRDKGVADALATYGKDDQRYKQALADKKNADQQYYNQKRQLELRAVNQQLQDIQRLKAAYHQYIDGTVNSAVSGLANVLDGTGTWRDAMIGIYNSIKQAAVQVISQIIENWIVNLLVGKAAQSETAVDQVISYSGIAGAAGVASWAGAPWPIDAGAPAFGASMASIAGAYTSLAALDTGTNYLPRDQIVQAHEGERVIPKADNRKLIELLNSSTGGRGGDHLHFHSSPTFNGNQASMWEHMVKTHEREMVRWFGRKFKNSSFDKAAA